MESNLLWQGLQLMLVGMGTVFAFLTLLVFATTAMSRVVLRLQPVSTPAQASAELPDDERDREEVAAIAAALALHQRR